MLETVMDGTAALARGGMAWVRTSDTAFLILVPAVALGGLVVARLAGVRGRLVPKMGFLALLLAAALLAVGGCASAASPDVSSVPGAETREERMERWEEQRRAREEDLRRSGSVSKRTGMAVPLALCQRGMRVVSSLLPGSGVSRLASACGSAGRL